LHKICHIFAVGFEVCILPIEGREVGVLFSFCTPSISVQASIFYLILETGRFFGCQFVINSSIIYPKNSLKETLLSFSLCELAEHHPKDSQRSCSLNRGNAGHTPEVLTGTFASSKGSVRCQLKTFQGLTQAVSLGCFPFGA
jgi:hypothetical protein